MTDRFYSPLGWILTTNYHNSKIHLFHPLSGAQIKLPKYQFHNINKFCFVIEPVVDISDYVVMMVIEYQWCLFSRIGLLVFWKPGNPSWTRVRIEFLFDITYHKGQLYAVDHQRRVSALNFEENVEQLVNIADVVSLSYTGLEAERQMLYLAESDESLLVVTQEKVWTSSHGRRTIGFQVFEVHAKSKTLARVKKLGDRALFLVTNSSSFSVKASDYVGSCKANCIYFADDFPKELWNLEKKEVDFGIFHLEDGKIENCFAVEKIDYFVPPLWVQPSF